MQHIFAQSFKKYAPRIYMLQPLGMQKMQDFFVIPKIFNKKIGLSTLKKPTSFAIVPIDKV